MHAVVVRLAINDPPDPIPFLSRQRVGASRGSARKGGRQPSLSRTSLERQSDRRGPAQRTGSDRVDGR
jgi:hypothetical protein